MTLRILASFLIYTVFCLPCMILSVPVVAYLLRTKWDGRSTIFGNEKWGRATLHHSFPTKNRWEEFLWLVWRNPVNNLMSYNLAVRMQFHALKGDPDIGDKARGGFYVVTMGRAWEYYWVKPYTIFGQRRCIRVRIGWKIHRSEGLAAFIFAINPWKLYLGQ